MHFIKAVILLIGAIWTACHGLPGVSDYASGTENILLRKNIPGRWRITGRLFVW